MQPCQGFQLLCIAICFSSKSPHNRRGNFLNEFHFRFHLKIYGMRNYCSFGKLTQNDNYILSMPGNRNIIEIEKGYDICRTKPDQKPLMKDHRMKSL